MALRGVPIQPAPTIGKDGHARQPDEARSNAGARALPILRVRESLDIALEGVYKIR